MNDTPTKETQETWEIQERLKDGRWFIVFSPDEGNWDKQWARYQRLRAGFEDDFRLMKVTTTVEKERWR